MNIVNGVMWVITQKEKKNDKTRSQEWDNCVGHNNSVACFPHAGAVEAIETSKGTQR
jgi:hypothetical protein